MDLSKFPMDESFEFKYYLYDEMKQFLKNMESSYPDLVEVEVIGQTYEGRDMFVAKVTNKKKGNDLEKPAYYIDANIHAGEVSGSTVALYSIHYLCTQYGKNQSVNDLMDNYTHYIVPRISIDGAERYLTSAYILRSSTRHWPYRDVQPGLHIEDMDGDGQILHMRMLDPLGDWKISKKDPRLMMKRGIADNDDGPYYRLLPEGRIHDWDNGPISISRQAEGLDLNRNSPNDWKQEHIQRGAGPFPLSEPETRNIADFIRDHPNISGAQAFHTFSGVILRPFSTKDDIEMDTMDLEYYNLLIDEGEKITGYPGLNIYKDFRYEPKTLLHGGFLDWMFDDLGIFCISTELWDMIKEAGIEDRNVIRFLIFERTEEEELKLLKWNDDNLDGSGYQNWKEYTHPQLGKVEIGGWKFKFTWQNPPLDGKKQYLPDICHTNAVFSFLQTKTSPLIRFSEAFLDTMLTSDSDEKVWKITMWIQNEGFLSTYGSEQAKKNKVVMPNKLKIDCNNCELVAPTTTEVEFPHLAGRINKVRNNVFAKGAPEDQRWRYEVTVKGKAGGSVEFTAISQRGGTTCHVVDLI